MSCILSDNIKQADEISDFIVKHFKFDTLRASPCRVVCTVFGLSSRLKIKVIDYITATKNIASEEI